MSLLLLFFPNRDQTAPTSWPTDFHREDFSEPDFSIQRVTGFVTRCLPYQIVYIKLGLVRRCLNVFVNMFIVSYLNMQEKFNRKYSQILERYLFFAFELYSYK